MSRSLFLVFSLICLARPVWAEAPRVAVDIAPLHGLVAKVMDGAGAPDLILRPGASPHGYALRPSEAGSLQAADVVFRIGAGLTPWLDGALESLAPQARVETVSSWPDTRLLPYREGIAFEFDDHDHSHDHDHSDDHGHDEHADHDAVDPHAWLDPVNARVWLGGIARVLSEVDPENAALYQRNATAGQTEISALVTETDRVLGPGRGSPFIVFHDAYQYFEARFGLQALSALALSDAIAPGAGRVAQIRDLVTERDVSCIFAEPQFNPGLIETIAEGRDVRRVTVDPQGSDLPLGPEFYPALMRTVAQSFATCLGVD